MLTEVTNQPSDIVKSRKSDGKPKQKVKKKCKKQMMNHEDISLGSWVVVLYSGVEYPGLI